jgi:hypothetical protein
MAKGELHGRALGFEAAKKEYEVPYYCARYGQLHRKIDTGEDSEAAADLMYEAGWHSMGCLEHERPTSVYLVPS